MKGWTLCQKETLPAFSVQMESLFPNIVCTSMTWNRSHSKFNSQHISGTYMII